MKKQKQMNSNLNEKTKVKVRKSRSLAYKNNDELLFKNLGFKHF